MTSKHTAPKGHTAAHGHANGAKPRESGAKFHKDLSASIARLQTALAHVQRRKAALEGQLPGLVRNYAAKFNPIIQSLLPDLAPSSVSKLNREVPGFLSQKLRGDIEAARNPDVPFFTWLFGGSARYKQQALDDAHERIVERLKAYLNGLEKLPNAFADVDAARKAVAASKAEINSLEARELGIQKQLEGLRRMQAAFSDPDRPVPPKLGEAVAKSANAPIASTQAAPGSTREFDYVDDVLIPQIIWNSYFDSRHRDYDHGWTQRSDWPTSTRSYEPEPAPRRDTRDEGNASFRMDDAAPVRQGHASMRMSDAAPVEEGNASVRMSDPVIADASEVGRGIRMDAEPANERSEDTTGGGRTAY